MSLWLHDQISSTIDTPERCIAAKSREDWRIGQGYNDDRGVSATPSAKEDDRFGEGAEGVKVIVEVALVAGVIGWTCSARCR